MKNLLRFLSLGALLLGLSIVFNKPQTVKAETMVAIPVQNSRFVTAGKNITPTRASQLKPSGSVFGLSAWKVNATAPLVSSAGLRTWQRASSAYKVGQDTWLVNGQVLVIPQGKIVETPLNFLPATVGKNYVAGIVDNNGPVALWGSTDYTHQVGTVKPGSVWTITRYYADPNGSVWFDLGNNQWLPSFYFNNSLLYGFDTPYNNPDLYSKFDVSINTVAIMQHAFTVKVSGDATKQAWGSADYLYTTTALNAGSQWLCYETIYYGDNGVLKGTWYQIGPKAWVPADYVSLD